MAEYEISSSALMSKQSILEYAPSSLPAEEYYHLVLEEWYKINNSDPCSVAERPFLEMAEV